MDELQIIQSKIYVIRGLRVMLDFDLAILYEVESRSLNQTVKRNARRFPNDFMFQLTEQEWILISSQFVTTSRMKRPKKSLPYAFTELGALMLSSILRSPVADAHILFFLHSTKFKVNIFRSRWHKRMSTASFSHNRDSLLCGNTKVPAPRVARKKPAPCGAGLGMVCFHLLSHIESDRV